MVVRAQTFQPLPLRLRERFVRRFETYRYTSFTPGRFTVAPDRAILFTYDTGAHPADLAHPRSSGLQVLERRILFRRPKTNRAVGAGGQGLVITDRLWPWIHEWVGSLREPETHVFSSRPYTVGGGRTGRRVETRTRSQDICDAPICYMVERVCSEEGFPGVTCRTLRHTFGNRVWLATRNIRSVMDALAVNEADAVRYCVEAPEDSDLGKAVLSGEF